MRRERCKMSGTRKMFLYGGLYCFMSAAGEAALGQTPDGINATGQETLNTIVDQYKIASNNCYKGITYSHPYLTIYYTECSHPQRPAVTIIIDVRYISDARSVFDDGTMDIICSEICAKKVTAFRDGTVWRRNDSFARIEVSLSSNLSVARIAKAFKHLGQLYHLNSQNKFD